MAKKNLVTDRYESWHDAYTAATNTPVRTQQTLAKLLKSMIKTCPEEFGSLAHSVKVLDIGTGKGIPASKLAYIFNRVAKKTPEIYGIDKLAGHVKAAQERFKGQKSRFLQGDMSAPNAQLTQKLGMGSEANIVMAFHVAYYPFDDGSQTLDNFIDNTLDAMNEKSMGLFLHVDPKSDLSLLREKYSQLPEHYATQSLTQKLTEREDSAQLHLYKVPVVAKIAFPAISAATWARLENAPDSIDPHAQTDSAQARNLAEFFIHTGLETLDTKTRKEYLHDLRQLVDDTSGQITTVLALHVTMKQPCDKRIKAALDDAVSQTQSYMDNYLKKHARPVKATIASRPS